MIHATPEEKERMIRMVQEIREISASLIEIRKLTVPERTKKVERLQEIKKEFAEFRRKYPND